MRLNNKTNMTNKFQNKYRIPSARLQNWDYGSNAAYFVTICTQNRECFLGDILDGIMELSEIGEMAEKYWLEIPNHFPFIFLDCYIIMPNHIHGIIEIKCRDAKFCVSTGNENKFGPQSKNLASIIRGFKTGVKKYATINKINFVWQKSFYEHIIRGENDLNRVREYIRLNPLNWKGDRNNREY